MKYFLQRKIIEIVGKESECIRLRVYQISYMFILVASTLKARVYSIIVIWEGYPVSTMCTLLHLKLRLTSLSSFIEWCMAYCVSNMYPLEHEHTQFHSGPCKYLYGRIQGVPYFPVYVANRNFLSLKKRLQPSRNIKESLKQRDAVYIACLLCQLYIFL